MPTKRIHTLPVVPFTAGKTEKSDRLPTNFVETGFWLRMNMTADTGATAPTYRDEAPWNLVRAFRLIKDGETIINISGEALFFLNYALRGQNNPHLKPTGVNAADGELKSAWFFPFKYVQTGDPSRTYIDGSRIENWHLEVDWGDGNTLASANVPTDLKGNLEISTNGFLAGGSAFPRTFQDPVIIGIERNFASATKTAIELNRSHRHRAWIIRVSNDSDGYTLSDAKLNSFQIDQLETVKTLQLTYEMAAFQMAHDRALTEDYDGGAPTITESEAEGYLFVDPIELGLDDSPDGASKLDLTVDVDAATRLNITQLMFKKAAAA